MTQSTFFLPCNTQRTFLSELPGNSVTSKPAAGFSGKSCPPRDFLNNLSHVAQQASDVCTANGITINSGVSRCGALFGFGLEESGHDPLLRRHGSFALSRAPHLPLNGARDLRGNSADAPASARSTDDLPPSHRNNHSDSPMPLYSSNVLQGVGGGRRIFRRVGKRCVYDIKIEETDFVCENKISAETCEPLTRPNSNEDNCGFSTSLLFFSQAPSERTFLESNSQIDVKNAFASTHVKFSAGTTALQRGSCCCSCSDGDDGGGLKKKIVAEEFASTHERWSGCSFNNVPAKKSSPCFDELSDLGWTSDAIHVPIVDLKVDGVRTKLRNSCCVENGEETGDVRAAHQKKHKKQLSCELSTPTECLALATTTIDDEMLTPALLGTCETVQERCSELLHVSCCNAEGPMRGGEGCLSNCLSSSLSRHSQKAGSATGKPAMMAQSDSVDAVKIRSLGYSNSFFSEVPVVCMSSFRRSSFVSKVNGS